MAVFYDNKKEGDMIDETKTIIPLEKFFNRFYKFRLLIPIFPKWKEELDQYLYKESFLIIISLSLFFYLLGLFFVYLGITDRNHITSFLLVAFGWLAVGLIIPSVSYRLIVFILKKKHLVN